MERKIWTVSDGQGGRKAIKVTKKVTKKVIENLDDKSLKILQLLEEDPGYKYAELAKKLSVSEKTIFMHLKKLQNIESVERVGSARNGYWKVTIR